MNTSTSFSVSGEFPRDVRIAVHEAGHAVAALRFCRAWSADGTEALAVKKIVIYHEGHRGAAGQCFPGGLFTYADDILSDLAGHQAERACGFPRDCFSPTFQYRDSDHDHAVKVARDIFYSALADKEFPLLSNDARKQLYSRHHHPCPYWDEPEHRDDALKSALCCDLQKRHRVSIKKLKPILDRGVLRGRRFVRQPENLRLIKILATALLQAPRDTHGDRVLTGERIRQLTTTKPVTGRPPGY